MMCPGAGAARVTDRGWGIFQSAALWHEAKFGVVPPCEGIAAFLAQAGLQAEDWQICGHTELLNLAQGVLCSRKLRFEPARCV